jgi:hypothetical protein
MGNSLGTRFERCGREVGKRFGRLSIHSLNLNLEEVEVGILLLEKRRTTITKGIWYWRKKRKRMEKGKLKRGKGVQWRNSLRVAITIYDTVYLEVRRGGEGEGKHALSHVEIDHAKGRVNKGFFFRHARNSLSRR